LNKAIGNNESLESLSEKVRLEIAFKPKEKSKEKALRHYNQEKRLAPSFTTSSETRELLSLL